MNLTYQGILSDVRRQNYVEVPLPITKERLDEAAQYFLDFLTLPQQVKDTFRVFFNKDDPRTAAGYVSKKRAEGESDDKEYFNYRKISELLLQNPLRKNRGNQKVENFFNSAKNIFGEASEVLEQVISTLDQYHPGIHAKIFSQNAEKLLCLRFVKYNPVGKGEFLAKAHYDSGSCALALAESAPGLRAGKNGQSLKEIVRSGNTGIFMPAFTFAEDICSEEFTATWHDVVQKSEDLLSETVARWALILFADTNPERNSSYDDTHTAKTEGGQHES